MNTSGAGVVNHTDYITATDSPSLPFWSSATYLCILSVITVVSVLGNCLLVTVQYYTENKTSTDWIVTFMAAIDLITTGTDVSATIVHFSGYAEYIGLDALCSVVNYMRCNTQYASSLLFIAVAIERFFKTCRPHSTAFSTKRTTHLCIGITLVSCLPGIPILSSSNYQVAICRMTGPQNSVIRMFGNVMVACYIAMFASLIVLYTKIGFAMRKRLDRDALTRIEVSSSVRTDTTFEMTDRPGGSEEVASDRFISSSQHVISTNRRDETPLQHTNRITFIMGLLTFVFVVTWTLFFVKHLLFQYNQSYSVNENVMLLFQGVLPLVNTITNPIFFIIMSSKFRQQSNVVLRKRYMSIKNFICR